MPKVVLFSILWGMFWDIVFFGGSGMYVLPPILAAAILAFSPLIIKTLNILIAGVVAWSLMMLWSFGNVGLRIQFGAFGLHAAFYIFISLIFMLLIYVWETKKQV